MQFHLSIGKVLSIYHSPIVFFFENFIIYNKDLLKYSDQTDELGKLCYNLPISNVLTHIINFPARIPDNDSHSPVFFFFFHIGCVSNSNEDASFHRRTLICSYPD